MPYSSTTRKIVIYFILGLIVITGIYTIGARLYFNANYKSDPLNFTSNNVNVEFEVGFFRDIENQDPFRHNLTHSDLNSSAFQISCISSDGLKNISLVISLYSDYYNIDFYSNSLYIKSYLNEEYGFEWLSYLSFENIGAEFSYDITVTK